MSFTKLPVVFEPTRPALTYCYAPSSLESGTRSYDFYCGNPGTGKIVDWIILHVCDLQDVSKAYEVDVLKPTTGEWDSRHVCDPSVVQGSFTLRGNLYSYAMFYTGTQDPEGKGFGNSIGVAFANALEGPWTKCSGGPLIPQVPVSALAWGVGQPTATAVSRGQVLLSYTRSEPATRMCAQFIDLTNADEPKVLKEEWELPIGGLPYPMFNGDVAYNHHDDKFYMIHEARAEPKSSSPVASHVFLRSIASSNYWAGTGSWTLHATIDKSFTGWDKNHNAGIIRNTFGGPNAWPHMQLRVTVSDDTSWPKALFTYRLVSIDVKQLQLSTPICASEAEAESASFAGV